VLAKITYAGSNNTSYLQAENDLEHLAELDVSDKQVRRLCLRIGSERVAERDAAVTAYQALPLVERKSAPAGVTAPAVAAIMVDGGRLQIFERPHAADAASPPATAPAAPPAPPPASVAPAADPALGVATATAALLLAVPAAGGYVPAAAVASLAAAAAAAVEEEDEERRGRFWREDKIGLLLTLHSRKSAHDPCPHIPKTFLHPTRMAKLVRELKKRAPPQEEALAPCNDPDAAAEVLRDPATPWEPPEVQTKYVVASRRSWAEFGPMVAAAAWAQGFFAAERRAFVGDGAENNWTVHRLWFSSFVPILDFIHALSYVFAAAMAGRGFKDGWACYEQWIQWVWSGEVEQVIAALTARQAELGAPTADAPAGSPRAVVARALTYLQNNQERMRYAEYRRQGLPIMSSYVESAVKQMNYRVKGTEKFWNDAGAEPLLQLRSDYLSDGDIMTNFWRRRETSETGLNRYRRSV
jgi:hypothetical protein